MTVGRPSKPFWNARDKCWQTVIAGAVARNHQLGPDDHAGVAAWFAAEMQAARDRARSAHDPTAEALAARWLEANKPGWEEHTYDTHREQIAMFLAWKPPGRRGLVGDMPAREVRGRDLETLRDELLSRPKGEAPDGTPLPPRSPHTVAKLVRSVKACWGWGSRRVEGREPARLVDSNPMRDVTLPRLPKSPIRVVEGDWDLEFLRWLRERSESRPDPARRFGLDLLLLIEIVRATGCRPGELCRLTWGDVRWDLRALQPERHKNRRHGKIRTIPLRPDLLERVREIFMRPVRHPVQVFSHRVATSHPSWKDPEHPGEPWDSRHLARRIRALRLRIAAERPDLAIPVEGPKRFVAYLFRHDKATAGLRKGESAVNLAALLGTSSKLIEDTYGHHTAEDLHAIDARVSGSPSAASPPGSISPGPAPVPMPAEGPPPAAEGPGGPRSPRPRRRPLRRPGDRSPASPPRNPPGPSGGTASPCDPAPASGR